jgi:hypothetical protein
MDAAAALPLRSLTALLSQTLNWRRDSIFAWLILPGSELMPQSIYFVRFTF